MAFGRDAIPQDARLGVEQVRGERRFAPAQTVAQGSSSIAPVGGEVVETNGELAARPELVNGDPLGDGWMLRVRVADMAQFDALLDQAAYDELTKEA